MDNDKEILKEVMLAHLKEQIIARRWKIFFRLFWLGLIIGVVIFGILNGFGGGLKKTGPQVALVELKGEISRDSNTYANFRDSLQAALEDKSTVGVIIRANSPGGSPVYSDMIFNEILRLRVKYPKIPIEVVVEEVCASGCYYIASSADKIYASPASIVGSIGVIYEGFGVTGLMQKIGIDNRVLTAGKNKAMGDPFEPLNPEWQKMQQVMLDKVHVQFIQAVKRGRGKYLKLNDPDLFSGRYWVGEEGLKLGLIDGFATVDSLARTQFKSENIVDFTKKEDPLDRLTKKMGTEIMNFSKQLVEAFLGQRY